MRTVGAVASVIALAALVACIPSKPVSVRIDPALAALVPNDTTLLVGMRVESLKESVMWKKYIQDADLPGLVNFVKTVGLDPRQDIYETLVASDGKSSVFMARGKFSPEGGLEPRLNFPNAQRIPYKTYTLIGREEMSVVFMNPSVAVAAPVPVLKSLIDRRGGGLGVPPALAAAVDQIPATNQIWAASTRGLKDLNLERLGSAASAQVGNFSQFIRSVESFRMMADLRAGLNLTVVAECTREEDARRLNDALRGLIGLARLQTADNQRELLRSYDSIRVSHQQRTLTVGADLTQDQIEKLLAEARRLGVSRGSGTAPRP